MATNIPPHNLGETIDAVKLVMDNPEVTTKDLMEVLPGPDFPTGALVMGKSGIHKAYETGKGSIVLRSRTEIETTKTGRERIVVTEFPYMVNKTKVHEHIVRLVQENALRVSQQYVMSQTVKVFDLLLKSSATPQPMLFSITSSK